MSVQLVDLLPSVLAIESHHMVRVQARTEYRCQVNKFHNQLDMTFR